VQKIYILHATAESIAFMILL